MTHNHDFELIAAIAEGEMSPAEQEAAEASLATCATCQTDLELQREALAVLWDSPPVTMTDLERATLHRNVSRATTLVVPSRASRPTAPWFQRLMPAMAAAAALLVVVGVGSVLVNGADDADTALETTVAATESQRAADEESAAESAGGAEFDDLAEPTTTTMGLLAPTASIVEDYGEISSAALKNLALAIASEQQQQEDGGAYDLDRVSLEQPLVCAEIVAEEGTITFAARATVDGEPVEIYRRDGLIEVFSTADCILTESFE